ncbi:MAG TPA: carboxypeptidase regulatory-like domain-containing protein [Bryobacteraceae bacterium]|nr:carboxypeptidase regulatory-like domain-containing protein [Bryobacteraceae bacterium]
MSRTFRIGGYLFFVLWLGMGIAARAQGLGTIVGTVTDPSGGVVPSAAVTITDQSTSASRETATNAQGYFVFPSTRPATYSLEVKAAGFSSYIRKNIILQADQSATVNVALPVQQATQTVTVESAPPQVNTSTATLSEVVDQRRIVDLPLNGRNAASLALITAGTVLAPGRDADQGSSKTFPGAVTLSANGSRQNQTSFRLDGANNNDIYTNVNQPFPFPDALQEFSVQTSNYSARYGGNAGGVVNIVTKSGSNGLHGNLFEFNRNAVFNARNFFASKRDQLKRNQYGGTLGGPIIRNKTFFFIGYQGTRIRNVSNSSNAFVPTAAELNGDFSAFNDASNPNNPLGKKVQINDPNGGIFPGNIIPVNRFDPAAVALTKYLPAATGSGLVFYGQPLAQNFDEMVSRIDHNISDKDRLSGRYFFDRFYNTPSLDLKNYLSNSSFTTINSHNLMLNETHLFSPTILNDFRISYAREVSQRGPASGSINAADLGVNIYEPPGDKIIESLSVSGFFSIGQTDPATFTRNQYNLSDSFSWVIGPHSLNFGVDVSRAQVILRNQFLQPGQFSFTADVTNLAMASFLLGKLRSFRQGNGEFKDNLVNSFGLYFQDDYHVSRKLTLNLGLRYDPFFPWKETRGRVEQFRTDAYAAGLRSQQFLNAPPGLLFPGDPGVPQYGLRGSYKNFAPRLGFAYDVSGDGRTAIRGGFGMFYDSQQNGIYNNRFVDVTPFSTQITLTDPQGSFSNPYSGIANPFPAPFPPPKDIAFPLPLLVVTYDPANDARYQTPVSYNYNLTVERQFAGDWMFRLGYVGSRASHILETIELSPAVYIPGSKLSTDQRRLFPQYGSIAQSAQDINSSYNSLQATLQKRFSRGFTILANYTWSKSIDDLPQGQGISTVVSGSSSPIPWNQPGRHQFDRGPSEFDHTHRLVTSFVWSLPTLANRSAFLHYVIGGWQLSGLLSAQSGGPLTILAGKDQSQTGLGSDRGVATGTGPYGEGGCGLSAPCVNYLVPSAFALPAVGTYGTLGRGVFRGPNLITYDGGLFKDIPLHGERYRIQFRAEFFNLFNRVNFNDPGTTISSAGFGSIKGAGDPRIGQLALKFLF